MRALCASIITAGALVGLGLTAIGVGTRYQNLAARDAASVTFVKFVQLDTPMMLIIVALLTTLLAGLAATFLGLAYHHERRQHERHGLAKNSVGGVSGRD
ncbi:MAG: hypothetical protein JWN86_3142 [Planctomycetota bacterium]|nr:hypothetical protein [Planctomycetota bacterium]